MPTSVTALARLVGGTLVGDASLELSGAATLADVRTGEITLVDKNERAGALASSVASAVVVPRGFPLEGLKVPAIEVDDVHKAFTAIVLHFRPQRPRVRIGISPGAHIHPTAKLAADVDVHPTATIGPDVEIGPGSTIHCGARVMAGCQLAAGVTIHCNAVLYEGTIVGEQSVIHANAVIGAHGFGYRVLDGRNQPAAQLGWVEVGSDCEIGACSTVDRGTYGPTILGDGTKLDNLVMIAHNCRIGKHNMICSQVGVAGSTVTGDYVVMAGQVGVRDHVRIGDRAILAAKAGVSCDVPDGAHFLGTPAIPEREQKIQFAAISKLPEMRRQLKRMEKALDALTREQASDAPASGHSQSSGHASNGHSASNGHAA